MQITASKFKSKESLTFKVFDAVESCDGVYKEKDSQDFENKTLKIFESSSLMINLWVRQNFNHRMIAFKLLNQSWNEVKLVGIKTSRIKVIEIEKLHFKENMLMYSPYTSMYMCEKPALKYSNKDYIDVRTTYINVLKKTENMFLKFFYKSIYKANQSLY